MDCIKAGMQQKSLPVTIILHDFDYCSRVRTYILSEGQYVFFLDFK